MDKSYFSCLHPPQTQFPSLVRAVFTHFFVLPGKMYTYTYPYSDLHVVCAYDFYTNTCVSYTLFLNLTLWFWSCFTLFDCYIILHFMDVLYFIQSVANNKVKIVPGLLILQTILQWTSLYIHNSHIYEYICRIHFLRQILLLL